jgi:hypothetical protein
MFNRPLLLVGILAAAVVVPYLLLDDNLAATAKAQFSRLSPRTQPAHQADPVADLAALIDRAQTAMSEPLPAHVPLEQALRFDLTPEWVKAQWPQASSVAGGIDYLGLRVAYVSGTQPHDVAGSLTYYFDEGHVLQRITLSGQTRDPARLVAINSGHYGLAPARTLDAALYIAGDPAKPTSQLRVIHLPGISTGAAGNALEVSLDLKRDDAMQSAPSRSIEPAVRRTYSRW